MIIFQINTLMLDMIQTRRASQIMLALLLLTYITLASSLSINRGSVGATKSGNTGPNAATHQQHARHLQHNLHQSAGNNYNQHTTTSPQLMTTIAQGYIDSLASQLGAAATKQQQLAYNSITGTNEQRSSAPEEHDDSVPMATINNHSRNNQPPARPAQYVDVAGLVGVSLIFLDQP